MAVLLDTTLGELVFDLNVDACPAACANFVNLCRMKHFNNMKFGSIDRGFI